MIAVTGANGLVGSFVVKKFVEANFPVTAIVRKGSNTGLLTEVLEKIVVREADVLDVPSLTDALEGAQTVVHAAAIVSFNSRKAGRIINVNVQGTKNAVNVCLTSGVKKFIQISSVAALGRAKGMNEINEDSKWADSPLNTDYGLSKYLAELEVFRAVEEGLNATIINPSVVLAPADWNRSSARVFKYCWQEKPFYTDGNINFVDVRDLAEMVLRISALDFEGHRFIANGGAISLHEFFAGIATRFHKKPPSIRVSAGWARLVSVAEEFRCWLAGTEPLITRQSARLARETFFYDQKKAVELLKMHFRPLEETLDWCCATYLRNDTTNK